MPAAKRRARAMLHPHTTPRGQNAEVLRSQSTVRPHFPCQAAILSDGLLAPERSAYRLDGVNFIVARLT